MGVDITFADDTLYLKLNGEIDHHTALPIRLEADDRIESARPAHTVMDFSRVSFMDSSGIGLVMGRYRLVSQFGGDLEVTGLSGNAYRVMRLAGIDRIADIKKGGAKANGKRA